MILAPEITIIILITFINIYMRRKNLKNFLINSGKDTFMIKNALRKSKFILTPEKKWKNSKTSNL